MTETPADPAQLAAAIEGLSDEQLDEQLRSMGYDETLAAIFAGMQGALVPERASGVTASIQYEIKAEDDVKSWYVQIADGSCRVAAESIDNPRLTLQLGIVDFVRLIFNQVQGPQLFMSGKLKLKGDMMFAMQMQNFFERAV